MIKTSLSAFALLLAAALPAQAADFSMKRGVNLDIWTTWPGEEHTVLAKPFEAVSEWAARHGVAAKDIFLGEFGMIRQEYGNPYVMPGAWRAAYVGDMIALAERHGFAWSVWSHGGAFGIVDEFESREAEPDTLEMIRGLPKGNP